MHYEQRKDTQLPRALTSLAPRFQLLRSETLRESVINLKMSRDPCDVHFTKEIKLKKKKKHAEQLEERGNSRSLLHFVT